MASAATTARQASILIVDDDLDIALGLHDLMRHMGFRVEVRHTGIEALAKAQSENFDAVLLDLMLPDIDGLSVLSSLRAIDPNLPIIIISAFADVPKKHGSFAEGAFAYVTKPYDTEELKALVRRAVGIKNLTTAAAEAKEALVASETQFREVVETAPDAIILANGDGCIHSWNAAAESLFGYSAGEVAGQPLTMLMPARYHDAHLQAIQLVRTTGRMQHRGRLVKVHGRRKDGTEFPIEMSLSTWTSHGQQFFCGILRDVSAREEAEIFLRRRQIEQQTLLDLIPAMVWYKDGGNRILRANQRAADSIKKSVEEVEGQSTYDLYPEDAAKYHRDDLEVIASGQPKLGIIEPYRDGSGDQRWVRTDKVPYRDIDGTVLGVLVFAQDITDRKRMEEALRASEERLRVIVESSPNGIVMVNKEGVIVLVNPALATLFGYTQQDLTGRSVDMLVPERFRPRHAKEREEFFNRPGVRRMGGDRTIMGLKNDGTEFPIVITLAPLVTAEGTHVAASVVHIAPHSG